MKRKIAVFVLISAAVYGQEETLDNMLNSLEKISYENQVYDIQKTIDKNKEKFYKLDNYNGTDVSVNSNYNNYESAFVTEGKVKYGDFYLDGQKKDSEKGEYSVGVEKSLKNLIFSKSDSELSKLNFTKEKNRLTYLKNLETQKLSLVSLYKDYKSDELELKIRENGLKTLQKELQIIDKSYKLGAAAQIELKTLEYSIKNMELEIKNLKLSLEKMTGRFYYDYELDIKGKNLAPIAPNVKNIEGYISRVGEREIEGLDLEKKIIEENIKYLKYDDKVPEISIGVEHNSKYDEGRITAKFSKKILNYNVDLENEKESLQKNGIILKQKAEEMKAERLKLYNNLYSYEKNYEINSNKAQLENSKYEIKRLEYNMGKVSYIDVMDAFDKYLEAEIAKEKSKNSLNSYIYEIMIRSER